MFAEWRVFWAFSLLVFELFERLISPLPGLREEFAFLPPIGAALILSVPLDFSPCASFRSEFFAEVHTS